MKKKLRDLTLEDYKKWMGKNCKNTSICRGCIFDYVNCNNHSRRCWLNNKDLYSDKFLDQKIEVGE